MIQDCIKAQAKIRELGANHREVQGELRNAERNMPHPLGKVYTAAEIVEFIDKVVATVNVP